MENKFSISSFLMFVGVITLIVALVSMIAAWRIDNQFFNLNQLKNIMCCIVGFSLYKMGDKIYNNNLKNGTKKDN